MKPSMRPLRPHVKLLGISEPKFISMDKMVVFANVIPMEMTRSHQKDNYSIG